MSDLHGNLIHIQKCDLCLIAGDVVPLNIQKNRVESIVWFFQDFLPPSQESIHAGGQSLAEAIQRIKPRYVFCGHLHTCKDKYLKLDNTEIYNVSILDNHISYEPTYLEID